MVSHPKNASDVFEDQARYIWNILKDSNLFSLSVGEETLTDLVLLNIKRENPKGVNIRKHSKSEESLSGLDWEFWITYPGGKIYRFAIQAKKIGSDRRYRKLWHDVSGVLQIDTLDAYAKSNNAIPIYCFFNYIDSFDSSHWHCKYPIDAEQLGWTILHSAQVRKNLNLRGGTKFSSIHRHKDSLPMRCLVKCPDLLRSAGSDSRFVSDGFPSGVYDSLPNFLQQGDEIVLDNDNYYSSELSIYPKLIVTIDLSNEIG